MLRCLFGKCSSQTYVVNQFSRNRSSSKTNGVSKIGSIPDAPPSPTEPELSNHQNVETHQITAPITTQPDVRQDEQSNNQDTGEIKSIPQILPQKYESHENPENESLPTLSQILPQKQELHENPENESSPILSQKYQSHENPEDEISPTPPQILSQKHDSHDYLEKQDVILREEKNSGNNRTEEKENNTSVSLKTRSRAPQPPDVNGHTVDTGIIVSMSESEVQHEPILREREQNNNENSDTYIQLNQNTVVNEPGISRISGQINNKIEIVESASISNDQQEKNGKIGDDTSASVKNSEQDTVVSAPGINSNSGQIKNKMEIVESATIINDKQEENGKIENVTGASVINSEQDTILSASDISGNSGQIKNKMEIVESATIINDQQEKNGKIENVTSSSVINSEQDAILSAPDISGNSGQIKNKMEIVESATIINDQQEKNGKIENVTSASVINSEQDTILSASDISGNSGQIKNKMEIVESATIINDQQEKNGKIEDVTSASVINSEQDTILSAPDIRGNSGQIKNKMEIVESASIINDQQEKNSKIEDVTSASVINSEQDNSNTTQEVTSIPLVNSEHDLNNKIEKTEVRIDLQDHIINGETIHTTRHEEPTEAESGPIRRRSGVVPLPVKYDENKDNSLPHYPKDPDDEALLKSAIESNDFLNKIISGKRLEDVIYSMYNKEIAAKEIIIKQGEKGSHMYISAKGKYQVIVDGKVVNEFDDVRVFGEIAILYNAKRQATIKAVTPGRVWVLDRSTFQQIMLRYNIKEQDEVMRFLMKNNTLNVVGTAVMQEVANLLKPEFFASGKQIVRQGDKGHKFYIIRAGTVTITKEGEGIVGIYEKGDCFGELALLKEDSRQATVTANPPGVECLTLTRKEFIDYFGEVDDITKLKPRPQNSIKDAVIEHGDLELTDLQIIKTLGVGGFGRVELVQHTKKKDLVFALKYLKKIDIVMQHQQDHVYNEKEIQMTSKSPFIIRLYRTYKDSRYIYFLMESCLGGDLFSLLQKQKLRRFEEKEARFIAACVLEAFDYLHSRGIVYRDLKPENLLIAANGYIKLTDFGFAKKISSRGRTYTFAGTPEYVAPEIVLNKGHDRAVDYWAFGAFIFELLTGRTPFRTDDSTHMKTYNKILNGIDNIAIPGYVLPKAKHIIEKLCRPIPAERLGMQRGGIKDIKMHKWFLGWDWQKFAKCEMSSPFKPKLKSPTDTQYFDKFKKDTDNPPQELSGWDANF